MTARIFFAWSVACWQLASLATGSAAEAYTQQKDVVYADRHGLGLVMDIFRPSEKPNGRGLVVVASGAWSSSRSKIRDLGLGGVFAVFCAHGYSVFAIRPGSVSHFSAAEMTTNIEEGIRWVKKNAADFAVDNPAQLGLFGASAGGHLASLVALTTRATDPRSDATVRAVGLFFPPTDFLDFGGKRLSPREDGGRISKHLIGLAFRDGAQDLTEARVTEATVAVSPARLVTEAAPPFLLIHGDADPLVPLQQSQVLRQALEEKGVEAELIVKKGGGHPWPTIRQEVERMAVWFEEKLAAP